MHVYKIDNFFEALLYNKEEENNSDFEKKIC